MVYYQKLFQKLFFLCDEVTEQVELSNLFFGFGYVSITVLEEIGHDGRDE